MACAIAGLSPPASAWPKLSAFSPPSMPVMALHHHLRRAARAVPLHGISVFLSVAQLRIAQVTVFLPGRLHACGLTQRDDDVAHLPVNLAEDLRLLQALLLFFLVKDGRNAAVGMEAIITLAESVRS
ncbi:hypothetical protein [Dryocola sp. BD586]|uniref:hypothetical protein n=1 Tax=Dryocola sp. BD586 TaxID=3133271 RepID=UPI003F507E82